MAAKKEWFAIQWVSKRQSVVGVSLDTSLENAQQRVETIINKGEDRTPLKGYITKIEHGRGFKETPEGEIDDSIRFRHAVGEAEPISKGFAILPQDKRKEMTYQDKVALSHEPVHALFFTVSSRTGVGTRPIGAFLVPLETLDNPEIGTDLYSLLDKGDETLSIDGDKAVVVTVYNHKLREDVLKSKERMVNIVDNSGRRNNIAVNLEPYITRSAGFYSEPEVLSKESISNFFMVDDDMGTVEIHPTGVFAEYQRGLKSAILKTTLEHLRSTSPEPS